MANIEGMFNASNYESGRVVTDLRDKIFQLNPAATPFLTFGQKLEGDAAHNPLFEWFEDDFLSWTDTAKSAAASTASTVYVDNAGRYAVDMVVWNQTSGERMLVTSVVSASDYILVTRAFGETAAATVLAADSLVILASAANEGAGAQNGLMTTKTSVFNYCQNFRTPYELTQQAMATQSRTGPVYSYESKKAGDEHKLQIERALKFGERAKVTASSKERFATRGLKAFIASANAFSVGGPLPEYDFDDWIRAIFRAGSGDAVSDTKILLGNDRLLAVINRYGKVRMQTSGSETKYGMNITNYITPHGTLKLVHDRMLDTAYSTTGYGLLYDPRNIRLRYFSGNGFDGHTKLHEDIQANDVTTKKDEYRTTVGLEVKHATTHGEISGVTG